MIIRTKELQEILQVLLHRIEQNLGTDILIDNDYYWDISQDEIYDVYKKPSELTMGQLEDDWQVLICAIENNVMYPNGWTVSGLFYN